MSPASASAERRTVVFKGRSGARYQFHAWPLDTQFSTVAGVYLVTRRTFDDPTFTTKATHQPLVIGHTDNLAEALISRSQRAKLVAQSGANCICVLAEKNAERRVEIETDLIEGNQDFRGRLQCLYYLSDLPRESSASPAGAP